MNHHKATSILKAVFTFILLSVSTLNINAEGISSNAQESADASVTYLLILLAISLIVIVVLLLRLRSYKYFKKIQEEDEHIKRRMNEIINTMPLLYMHLEMVEDENGEIVDSIYHNVNKAFEDFMGGGESCIGKHGKDMFPDSVPLFAAVSNEAKRTGKPVNFQYLFPGTDIYFDIVVCPCEDRRFMEYFCMDSTNLHRAQERVKRLTKKMEIALDVSHMSSWRWELDKHTVHCQKIVTDQSGNTSHKEISLTEKKLYSYLDSDTRKLIEQAVNELAEGKKARNKVEYQVTHYIKGKYHTEWVEVNATVGLRDNYGKPLTLVGSRQVITHRKEMEKELIQARKKAEESNRLKSSFLANMSHEIRTPLNAIVGFSDLLINTTDAEEQKEYGQIIESNSNLLLQLVGDILDLSKIEAGTMEFTYSDFDLNKLMKELEGVFRLRIAPDKPVALSYRLGMERCTINSERNRLTQLITNLVTNAIKFTDEGSITFGYELQGSMLRFSVKDTGSGIPQEQQKDVFKRFVKLNTFKQGTGLGLSICKSIVETLGGEIGLNSEFGKGSEFWFTIPYRPVTETTTAKEDFPKTTITIPQEISILVAEDNESNYKLISAILSKEYRLIHAWNGQEAVELFKEHKPQLVLMDINMPVLDGYGATSRIRQLSADVPILALTAYAYASDEEKILSSGMDSYLSKPINTQQLRNRIRSLLRTAAPSRN